MFLEAKIDQKLVDQAYVIQSNLFQSILKNVYVFELFLTKQLVSLSYCRN